ncbi:hypothetical protein GCM10028807_23310 [Spirosoma daeguense]
MFITTLTGDQLSQMMQDAVRQGIADYTIRHSTTVDTNKWFSIEELSGYLPGKPAITTLYGKVQRREIPHKKMGKRLVFLKSEIDQWLKVQHRKTKCEINLAAEQYLSSTQKCK